MTWWRRDVEQVNGMLRSGLSFRVEPEDGDDRPESVGAGTWREAASSSAERVAAGGCHECRARMRGVLVMVSEDGRRRTAACSIPMSGTPRRRRLSLARGLSECAMALGLGAGVYRRSG